MALHVKKGDNVLVLAGKDKGKTGKIVSADPKNGVVVVDGVNVVTKHKKPRSAQQPGGIEKVNGNIDASNVQIICPACGKATRIAAGEIVENGKTKKVRLCKKCGANMDAKAPKAEKKTRKAKTAEAVETPAEETVKKTTVKRTKKTAQSSEN